jgi:hypothetical protein
VKGPTAEELPEDRRLPHPARLATSARGYDEIVAAHARAMEAGEPFYLDPITGLYVMTAAHHWERGSCCDSGCRHCPYLERD